MNQKLKKGLVNYFSRVATLEELKALAQFIARQPDDHDFREFVRINYLIDAIMIDFDTEKEKKLILKKIKQQQRGIRKKKLLSFIRNAAVFVFVLVFGYSYYFDGFPFIQRPPVERKISIQPGTDKAILTLADETEVVLGQGAKLKQAGISLQGKQLVYNTLVANKKQQFNYLTIPRGGQFHVQLADGTNVWLNSESRLKYPVSFKKGQTRIVELVYGEAYFEVAPGSENQGNAFRVITGLQEIDVLGTAFNIKAYKDQKAITSTLVEGTIRLTVADTETILNPKEQIIFSTEDENVNLKKVTNLFDEIAWREGYFSFSQQRLSVIMETLSRWYDMEYHFVQHEKKDLRFTGILDRENDINKLLNYLQLTGEIKFKIHEKTITIE